MKHLHLGLRALGALLVLALSALVLVTCEEMTTDDSTDGTERPSGPNSCRYANDGECDEGTYCAVGTDQTDCKSEEPQTLAAPRDIPIPGSNLVLLGFGRVDGQPQVTGERFYFTGSEWQKDGDFVTLRLTADQPIERVWAKIFSESQWYIMAIDPPSTTFTIRFRMGDSTSLQIASAFMPPDSANEPPPDGAQMVQYAFESSNGALQTARCSWCGDPDSNTCYCCEYQFGPPCERKDDVACGCGV